jgi:hypothetical protein
VVANPVVTRGMVHSIRLRPEDRLSDFRNQKPSADTQVEYDGGPSVPVWTYAGSNEATEVTQIAGEAVEFTHTSGTSTPSYYRSMRVNSNSYITFQMCVNFRSAGTWSTNLTDMDQWAVRLSDNGRYMYWGTREYDATHVEVGLTANLTSFLGVTAILAKDVYHDIELRKYGQSHVEFYVNGQLIDTQLRSLFPVGINRTTIWGVLVAAVTGQVARVKHIGFYIEEFTEYWARSFGASTAPAFPQRVTITIFGFIAGDVGKQVTLSGANVTNAYGGNSDGVYEIAAFIAGNQVDVQGKLNDASANLIIGTDNRIVVPQSGKQFVYPDDLGKSIVIVDSDQGNNGAYVIQYLHDLDTDTDLGLWDTPLPTETNIAIVIPPGSPVTEAGLSWRLNPNFVLDSGMSCLLSQAGTIAGSTITLRQFLPYSPVVVDVYYSAVLSALIMLDFSVKNEIVQDLPTVLWAYYPFYITDPFGFLKAYLDDLTAAGVIPEYREV